MGSSMFDNEAREKARRVGGAEDYVKLTAGESMQFRTTKIGRVRMTTSAPNGQYEIFPLEVEVRWIKDERGNVHHNSPAFMWEPPADKFDGFIDLADKLTDATGDDREILKHDVIVEITKEKSKSTGNWFHIYTFRLAGAWPNGATPPAGRQGPPPSSSAPPPPSSSVSPAQAVAALRQHLGQCGNLAAVEAKARELWPEMVKAGATADAKAVIAEARIRVAKATIGRAGNQAELDDAWTEVAAKFENDPAAYNAITEAYHNRNAAIISGATGGGGFHDPAPAGAGDDDCPF